MRARLSRLIAWRRARALAQLHADVADVTKRQRSARHCVESQPRPTRRAIGPLRL